MNTADILDRALASAKRRDLDTAANLVILAGRSGDDPDIWDMAEGFAMPWFDSMAPVIKHAYGLVPEILDVRAIQPIAV